MMPRPCILLSASVPSPKSEYALAETERTHLDEAVMQIARAAFSGGARLVFGGHPAISPLVATIAGEYAELHEDETPRDVERSRRLPPSEDLEDPLGKALAGIYQSRVFEGLLPDETLLLFRMGFARIRWTEAVAGERFDPKLGIAASEQCPRSLTLMRTTMINESKADALVVAGGMSGINEEIALFRDLRAGAPIYLLGMTGGAAARSAHEPHSEFRVIDVETLNRLRESAPRPSREGEPRLSESRASREARLPDEIRPAVLYPIVVQKIVREVLDRWNPQTNR
jgi:hypothetical protein